jgi:4-hydroxy-tetrahydrodipicolinate synthase
MFSGSIPALVTPFSKDGSVVDLDALQRLVAWHVREGSDGIVIGGTTGEGPTLTAHELEEMVRVAKEAADGLPIIVGTGTNCTKKSVELTEKMAEMGVNGALIITPYYNKPTQRGIVRHFEEIAKVGLPLIAYHNPPRTGTTLGSDEIIELCSIKGVVGVKDCSGNLRLVREIVEKRKDLCIFAGDDDTLLEMLSCGAVGSISVMANLLPSYWKKMIHLFWDGEELEAWDAFEEIRTLLWSVFLEVNPQGIKCALAYEGRIKNSLRLPLVPVNEKTEMEIKSAMQSYAETSR